MRQADRERYLGKLDERRRATRDFVGIRKDLGETVDSTNYVRSLRRWQKDAEAQK